MTEVPTIDILLATYNGEQHLNELLESILSQTSEGWRLLIRDDGSTDMTASILDQYAAAFPEKICVIREPLGNLGIVGNFSVLLEYSRAAYIMFCDQDDVWLPDKVQSSFAAITELEKEYGPNVPLLVHGDLTVVDHQLRVVHKSFVEYQGLDPRTRMSLNRLLVRNVVTGCASIMNRRLKEFGLPVPAEAVMHDWWFALAAAAFGVSRWVPEAKILYRQHAGNVIGARRWSVAPLLRRFAVSPLDACRVSKHKLRAAYRRSQYQAAAFLRRYEDLLAPAQRDIVRCYAGLAANGFFKRRYYVCKFGFLTGSVVRDLATIAFV